MSSETQTEHKLSTEDETFGFHYQNVVARSIKEMSDRQSQREAKIWDNIFVVQLIIGGFLLLTLGFAPMVFVVLIFPFLFSTNTVFPWLAQMQIRASKKHFESDMIDKVLIPSLQYFLPDFSLDKEKYLSGHTIEATFLPHVADGKPKYYYTFNVEGNEVRCSNLYHSFSKRGNYRSQISGGFAVFKVPKHFEGHTVILSRKEQSWFHRLRKSAFYKSENEVVLESSDFNEAYRVFSENQVEARYLIDPAFMLALIDFSKEDTDSLSFAFYNGHLFVGLTFFDDPFAYEWWENRNWEKMLYRRVESILRIARLVGQLRLEIESNARPDEKSPTETKENREEAPNEKKTNIE